MGTFFKTIQAIIYRCHNFLADNFNMQNDAGEYVDLYVPRKCSTSNRIIHAKDHASIQLNVVEVDDKGVMTMNYTTYAICGDIRRMGESDDSLNRLAIRDNIMKFE